MASTKIKTRQIDRLDSLEFAKVATPANPSAGGLGLYFKSDNKLYKLDESGTETEIGASTSYTFSTGLTNSSGTVTSNLSVGVSGGQSVIGGTASGNSLTFSSTSHATKGKLLFGTSAYDEVNNRLGIGTASPTTKVEFTGSTTNNDPILKVTNSGSGNFTFMVNNSSTGNANFGMQIDGTTKATIGYNRTGNYLGFFHQDASPNYFLIQLNNDGSFQHNTISSGNPDLKIYDGGNTFIGSSPSNAGYKLDVNGTARIQDNLTVSDAKNIILGTSTGNKIGTSTLQKIGFWNASPIVQPTTGVAAATLVGGGGTALTDTDTFDGYTLKQIVKALRNIGLLA